MYQILSLLFSSVCATACSSFAAKPAVCSLYNNQKWKSMKIHRSIYLNIFLSHTGDPKLKLWYHRRKWIVFPNYSAVKSFGEIGNVFENLQTSSYENTATVSFMTETLLQLFILNRQPCVRIQNILVQSNSQFRADLFTVNKFCSSHFPPPFPACLCHSAHWLKLV